jgi:hypothetical protein
MIVAFPVDGPISPFPTVDGYPVIVTISTIKVFWISQLE